MKILLIVVLVLIAAWVVYGYVAIRGLEEPKYTVIEKKDGYELRQYEPHLVAETTVEGGFDGALNEGFRLIADYIFGNNTASGQIAMTVPVGEQKSEPIAMTVPVGEVANGGVRTISFVMPSRYTLATIPKPNNTRVTLREVPARKVAALSYSWWTGASYVESQKQKLKTRVVKDGLTAVGEPEAAFYNPPWSPPFMLRNEILLEVK